MKLKKKHCLWRGEGALAPSPTPPPLYPPLGPGTFGADNEATSIRDYWWRKKAALLP